MTMENIADIIKGKSAAELIQLGDSLRRENLFGEAINAYNAASAGADATEEVRTKARVAIELIQEINGFVNVDLMNP
jgi:predicted ATP-grasp superfamily ATP-dependent carboligase